jgi:hypothetical protein
MNHYFHSPYTNELINIEQLSYAAKHNRTGSRGWVKGKKRKEQTK